MVLLRLITLQGMIHNVRIFCKHVKTEENTIADSLSRGLMDTFWKNCPEDMNKYPVEIPSEIWPVSENLVKMKSD